MPGAVTVIVIFAPGPSLLFLKSPVRSTVPDAGTLTGFGGFGQPLPLQVSATVAPLVTPVRRSRLTVVTLPLTFQEKEPRAATAGASVGTVVWPGVVGPGVAAWPGLV